MSSTAPDLRHAAELIRAGGLVAFPTETVYGLGANAFDATAVARIFTVKGRPRQSPLIVHVDSIAMARSLASDWPAAADTLARQYWPGPLTLVLPKQPSVPDIVTAGKFVRFGPEFHFEVMPAENLFAPCRARAC